MTLRSKSSDIAGWMEQFINELRFQKVKSCHDLTTLADALIRNHTESYGIIRNHTKSYEIIRNRTISHDIARNRTK